MLLHGSEGAWSGYSYLNAAILAAHGFLAFPLGYSKRGNLWNAGDITDVALDRTVDALAALRAFAPSSGRVGLYGVSRGAEQACCPPRPSKSSATRARFTSATVNRIPSGRSP